jgi:hypothetical protein
MAHCHGIGMLLAVVNFMGVSSRFLEIKNGNILELCFAIGYISLRRGASDSDQQVGTPPSFSPSSGPKIFRNFNFKYDII